MVVDFLEGDPDQPLITGRVYNADQMPPWDLPANATQSGILTRSSKGGAYANANEIRFEDKKGAEQVWIHAEKNQDIEVENDETHWVGHDRTKTIDHDETTHVKHDRTETVDNNETITIGVDRTETVGSNETITIGANRTENVGANETITIGSNRTITVGASETATVALQRTHTVGVNETIAVGAAQEIDDRRAAGGDRWRDAKHQRRRQPDARASARARATRSARTNATSRRQAEHQRRCRPLAERWRRRDRQRRQGAQHQRRRGRHLKVGKNLVIDAGDSITITTGSASITMKKDGTITIKGKDITIDGSGKINVKAKRCRYQGLEGRHQLRDSSDEPCRPSTAGPDCRDAVRGVRRAPASSEDRRDVAT